MQSNPTGRSLMPHINLSLQTTEQGSSAASPNPVQGTVQTIQDILSRRSPSAVRASRVPSPLIINESTEPVERGTFIVEAVSAEQRLLSRLSHEGEAQSSRSSRISTESTESIESTNSIRTEPDAYQF